MVDERVWRIKPGDVEGTLGLAVKLDKEGKLEFENVETLAALSEDDDWLGKLKNRLAEQEA